jgi:predicted nucleic acid-binding protein
VVGSLILETTFLVDLEREVHRRENGPAHRFLDENPEQSLYLTFTISGELAAGRSHGSRSDWESFIAPFHVLPCTEDVCWQYGRLYRHLRDIGLVIGTNDLWIAATALAFEMPVVTANEKHYRRVPDLSVVTY